ncbi:MAG: cardiolipin hydrolase [Bradymonadia bacterium]|jgi:cardiolipin hydrolase
MHAQEFETILQQTLENGHMSRSETKAIRAIAAETPADQVPALRSRIFAVARTAADERHPGQVMDWMEGALKALIQPAPVTHRADVYFSPGEDCRNAIIGLLKSARETIDLCVFTITDNGVSKEIYAASRRGVKVRLITDNDKATDRGSDIDDLERAGVPVRVDHTENHMHHKFAIFDAETVLTGSYNWTRSAYTRNQENVIISDDVRFVRQFEAGFNTLWAQFR